MIIVKCDRCGKEDVIKNPGFPFNIFPKEEDTAPSRYMIMDGARQVNLCVDCEEAFSEFLGLNEVKDIEEERNCKNCFYFDEPPHVCIAKNGKSRVEGSEAETCNFFYYT